MKKISMLGMLLFLVTGIFAQLSPVHIGLKGGVNIATFNGANIDSRTGWNAGIFAHAHLSKHIALQPELQYSQQGAAWSNNQTQKLGYVNIPVLGEYMFAKGWRLQTGPQLGFLTHSTQKNGTNENHSDNAYKNADLSWSFGAGYLSPVGLGIDARYNLGLTDISKNNNDVKNRVWQIGLFYQLK